ncbi:amino acid permease [uncultured Caulobacter sp.]|jgi:basic amino acid/polyamine antiporter, APA family|uniref:amino acid permease n=1 Tax=uncultured Caulobacter sp. TaxID=158749 RepID=UPI002611B451|nr:amino acid permease [uncultured Caulobacter sp.]
MAPFRAADLLRRKPVGQVEGEHTPESLPRTIGLFQLTMLGVGATIGTGIFVALTTAVPAAGPAVILAFVLAGITAALTALCYAELASTIPVSGSSYSYAYATLGEFVAFIVGACLLLEYAVSASAIAVGWGQYLNEMLVDLVGWKLPDAIAKPPGAGGVFNLPAVALVGACMVLLLRGVKESTTVNAVLVVLKLLILAFFVVVAFSGFHAGNLTPFMPMGLAGVGTAAGSIFFSYIGIDAVSTAGEEVKDPRKTLPLGIVLSLLIVTAVYILVALAAVGAQPWTAFAGQEAGLAVILRNLTGQAWTSLVLCVGAIVSISSITLVVMYGQTRILYAMSRDGLLPKLFQRLHPKTRSPDLNTYIVAAFIAALAAFAPLDVLMNLTSMGTLIAFAIVSLGVIILRRTQPDLPRGYKVPLFPVLPALSVAFCGYLIWKLPADTWALFAIWVAGACAIYFGYSVRNSALNA